MKIFPPAIIFTVFVTPLLAQWAQYRTPGIPRTADGKPNLTAPTPRTSDGKPDLAALWQIISLDTAVGNVAARKPGDLKQGDILPWAQALVRQRADNFGIDNPHYKCLPEGPNAIFSGDTKRIVQTPSMILLLNEDLTYHPIFTDGRTLEKNPNPSWMGYSVGHWDGDTLVVESNGFNDRTWLLGGYPHTDSLRITERWRRPDFGHLDIAVTFEDPAAYSKPWTVPLHARLAADTELMEAVCNEVTDNEQQHWVGKVSDAEKSAVKVAPEVLAKYVGTFRGIYGPGPRTVEVSLADGKLFVSINGGPAQPIVPQSETQFAGPGLNYRFVRDDHGIATDVFEGHISGDYKYARLK